MNLLLTLRTGRISSKLKATIYTGRTFLCLCSHKLKIILQFLVPAAWPQVGCGLSVCRDFVLSSCQHLSLLSLYPPCPSLESLQAMFNNCTWGFHPMVIHIPWARLMLSCLINLFNNRVNFRFFSEEKF